MFQIAIYISFLISFICIKIKTSLIEWRHRCGISNKQASDSRVRYLKCWQNSKLLEFTIFKNSRFTFTISTFLRSDTEMAKLYASTTSQIGITVTFWDFATFLHDWDFGQNFCPRMFLSAANCWVQNQLHWAKATVAREDADFLQNIRTLKTFKQLI